MNPFVFACMTPHGGEIIPELQGEYPERMSVTRESMEELGKHMESANLDTIIVLTPHGTRINGQFSITDCERMEGAVEENGAAFHLERPVNRALARAIHSFSQKEGIQI